MIYIIIIAVVLLIIFIVKPYIIHYDTVIAFTGGLGSGKSLVSTQWALKLLRKNRAKVFFYNLRHPLHKRPRPMLYSSIPFRISRKEWAIQLTPEHLLLQRSIIPRSVTFIDEIDSWASQFDFKLPNIITVFNEFCRLYRHYTQGGYIVCNTQSSDNLVLQIRRRLNTVMNLMHFKKWFFLFYTVKVRNINLSEEIKTVDEENAEDNMSTLFGLLPVFCRHYDTYCYSGRYSTVPSAPEGVYNRLKTNILIECPRQTLKALTKTVDDIPSFSSSAPLKRRFFRRKRPPD